MWLNAPLVLNVRDELGPTQMQINKPLINNGLVYNLVHIIIKIHVAECPKTAYILNSTLTLLTHRSISVMYTVVTNVVTRKAVP